MINVLERYIDFCERKEIVFQLDNNVRPYDDTTLFCPAGMQQFKSEFKNPDGTTTANVQSCLRLQDIDEIGDGTHLLYFNMLGLFSFKKMTMQESVDFWVEFIQEELGLKLDYVTIHGDKMEEWKGLYDTYGTEIREDVECKWTDGEMGGYCTEFYYNDVEIGNIVNTNGESIDVGFGLERLEAAVNGTKVRSAAGTLEDTINMIINSAYKPGPQKQGYVLRKLLRTLYNMGGTMDHPFFDYEIERQEKTKTRYLRLKDKHTDKDDAWWFDTHGIDINQMKELGL